MESIRADVVAPPGERAAVGMDVMNATTDAARANDDASGVALVREVARVLSGRKFKATIIYAPLSGERIKRRRKRVRFRPRVSGRGSQPP